MSGRVWTDTKLYFACSINDSVNMQTVDFRSECTQGCERVQYVLVTVLT